MAEEKQYCCERMKAQLAGEGGSPSGRDGRAPGVRRRADGTLYFPTAVATDAGNGEPCGRSVHGVYEWLEKQGARP